MKNRLFRLLIPAIAALCLLCACTPSNQPAVDSTESDPPTVTAPNESATVADETAPATEAPTEPATEAPTEPKTEDPEIAIQERLGVNILKDSNFEYGFDLLGMDSVIDGTKVYKTVKFGEQDPVWKVGQWWSLYDHKDGNETNSDALYSLVDSHKSLTIDKAAHSLTLALDASQDIPHSSTTPPAKWPHFLIEQKIDRDACPFKDAESVTAKLAFTVKKSNDCRDATGLHAQFSWFIYIVDTNPDSDGYNNFLWFGLNLYCPPNRATSPYSSQDMANGPGNFIYSLSSMDIFERNSSVRVDRQVAFELDILPIVEEALTVARSRGFMIGTEVEDCSITGMNLGWEIFDRWDVSVCIDDIGIYRK